MQNGIYSAMQSRGWYPADQAQPQSIQQVRQKYSAQA
jgi:spore coat protein CotF